MRGRPGRRDVSPAPAAPDCTPCLGQLRQHLDPSRKCRGLLQPVLAGEFASDRVIVARNAVATLQDGVPSPRRNIYFRLRALSAVQRGRGKVVRPAHTEALELHDPDPDYAGTTNFAAEHREIVRNLCQEFENWLKDVKAD